MEQRLTHKPLVVKLGGSTLAYQQALLRDALALHAFGIPVILVHGGGAAISRWLHALALPVRFKQGLRVTDAATFDIVRMVLCGQVNQELVRLATHLGGRVVGLCGIDGGMIQAHVIDQELGFVGEIDAIHTEILAGLLLHHYLPIIAPLGLGADGTCLNINADQAAARLAVALGAETLVFVSDVAGISQHDGSSLSTLRKEQAQTLIAQGVIRGGMIPKVQAALTAVPHVSRVLIVNGREPSILLRAAFAHARVGTRLSGESPTQVPSSIRQGCREKPGQPYTRILAPSLLHLD